MEAYVDRAINTLTYGASYVAGLESTSERDGLSELETQDQELHVTKLALGLLNERMGHHLSAKIRRRNSHLPIFRLPNELLVEIIQISLTTDENYFRQLLDLALVSKVWNAVISKTPSLWAFIHSTYPRSVHSIILEKSKGSPLHVKLEGLQPGPLDPADVSSFLEPIYGEVHRWQTAHLKFAYPRPIGTLKRIESSAAPSLVDLVIDCRDSVTHTPETSILQGGTKRLRHLALYEVPIPWTSSLLLQLKSLTIFGYNVCGPSEGEAVSILRGCPDLVELHLSYSECIVDMQPIAMTLISLPSLATLKLHVPSHIQETLLTRMRIPACRKIQLWNYSPKIVTEATHHLAPVLHSIMRSVSVISITLLVGRVGVQADVGSTTAHLQIQFWQDSLEDLLTWVLGDPRSGPSLPAISFSAMRHQDDLISVLQGLPSVTELDLGEDGDEVVTFLTKPLGKDGSLRWPLPALKRLSLECCDTINPHLVIRMVESRCGKGRTGKEKGTRVLPCKLQHLRLPNVAVNSGDLQALMMLKKLVELSFGD
ncbi:hypothetical protein FRB93_000383 [Tulasnella sp. JGI-2019a]|nr:hypothetical protein FRB93_000383 [Tulasnella sp. JGI-2019a]